MSRRVLDDVSSSPTRQMHRDKGEVMECVGMEGDEVDCVQRHDQKGRVGGAGGAGGSTGQRDGDVLMSEVGEIVSQASEKSCRLISLIFRYKINSEWLTSSGNDLNLSLCGKGLSCEHHLGNH